MRRQFVATAAKLTLIAAFSGAQAQTATEIVIGQTGALTGTSDNIAIEFKAGADAYFNGINQSGGITGRKIKLLSLDDSGEPDKAKANTQKLIADASVLALFGYSGEHTIKAALPIIEKAKIPLIAPASGEQTLREPFSRYVFNIRASYQEEAERIVDQYVRRGVNKIALFYQNDPYGRAGLAGVDKAMRDRQLNIVLFGSVDRNATNVATAAQNIHKSGAQAVIIATGAKTAAAFIKEMKKLGSNAQFFSFSSVGSKALATQAGDDGRGTGVSQVVPSPTSESEPLVRDYIKAIGGTANASFSSLEGYIAAKVLVEGIRKSGKSLTRETLVDGLEKLGTLDLSGYKVKFSSGNHNGSSLVELTVLGAGGVYKR